MKGNKKEIFLTQNGLDEVKAELEDLKTNVRPEVISQIKEARAQGDLSENAEYHAARDRQGHVEARIKELEYIVDNATIIEEGKKDKVSIGSTVEIKYIDDDEIEEYSIVGSTEADPFENKISNESPIAIGIMGKKKGDKVTIESPNGSYDIEIVSIK
ncbi:MAG: transcription elongation factor GreA [Bacilli bacterium]|nr:transcription elongation factor GreA [Bacilli bacterium]